MRKVNNKSQRSNSSCTSQSGRKECDPSFQSDNQYTIVSTRKKSSKVAQQIAPISQGKILIEQLIQINDLIPQLRDRDILTNIHYFGKYGEITSAIVSQKQLQTSPKKTNYMAFITYKNDIDAAIAIVAMQNVRHSCHKFYCKYGTSRFCRNFLDGKSCTYKICLFQHKVRLNTFPIESGTLTKKQSIEIAKTKIVANLGYMVDKQYKEFLQKNKNIGQAGKVKCSCRWISKDESNNFISLPSIKNILDSLIKQAFIQEAAYLDIKNTYKRKINIEKQLNIASSEKHLKIRSQSSSQCPSLANYKSQLISNQTLQDLKVQLEHKNSPYIMKRYFYPQIKSLQLSSQSKMFETQYEKTQDELADRPRKILMSQKGLQSKQAFNNYLHQKIINKLTVKRDSKSFFDFTDRFTKEQMQKLTFEEMTVKLLIRY